MCVNTEGFSFFSHPCFNLKNQIRLHGLRGPVRKTSRSLLSSYLSLCIASVQRLKADIYRLMMSKLNRVKLLHKIATCRVNHRSCS